MAITVGVAAGLINAGVVFLQLTFPLLIVFLLVAILPLENNAITWSVVGRQLQGSFWPLILRSDSTSSSKVKGRVLIFSAGSTLGLILLAVSAVVTPLGLYERITVGTPQNVSFVYVKDMSAIGQATISRGEYRTSRLCPNLMSYYNCPGQENGFSFFRNATGEYIHEESNSSYISSVPPTNLSQIFGSGRVGDLSTVASALDIQFRLYMQMASLEPNSSLGLYKAPKLRIDQYRKRTVGQFSMYQSNILADDYVVVEGIVADMKKGGVGFRNHTVPAFVKQGVEWTESLLWIEPESACVDTNLTYKWSIIDDSAFIRPVIVDRGGFLNLTRDYPYLDLNDTQNRPELLGRAYKGAVFNNFNLLLYYNATRNSSFIGKTYSLPLRLAWRRSQLVMNRFTQDTSSMSVAGDYLSLPPGRNSTNMFLSAQSSVRGVMGGDKADIVHIAVDGGILLGAPVRIGGSGDYRVEPGTHWEAPIYSCVSTVKAYIMDVTFSINQTASLSNLRVKHMEPRRYASNSTTPMWAVEDTGFNVSGISPLWGMVADEYEKAPNLWTRRGNSLYLPAGRSTYWNTFGTLGMAEDDAWAVETPQTVLGTVYACGLGSTCDNLPDYTGKTNYPISIKWRELTKSPQTSGTIMNLIFTDIMMNYVTSSRSKLSAPGTDTTNLGAGANLNSAAASVILSDTLIQYHLTYAIPGIIFLACYLLILVVFIILIVFDRATFGTLRSLSNQTAVGRAMTIERYRGEQEVRVMPTKAWIEVHGDSDLLISKNANHMAKGSTISGDERSNHEVEVSAPLMPKRDTLPMHHHSQE